MPILYKQNCLADSFRAAGLNWIYSVVKETLISERWAIVVPKDLLFNDTTENISSYDKAEINLNEPRAAFMLSEEISKKYVINHLYN